MKKQNFLKIGIVLLVAGIVTFGACKKKELIKIIGIIQGVAYDGNTNAALDGVTATWSVNGKVKTSTFSTDGYTANELPPGEYYLTFKKDGYTTVVANEFINRDAYTGDERTVYGGSNIYDTHTVNPIMYPLTASLKGTIFKWKNGLTTPAEGVIVSINYDTPADGDDAVDSKTQGITPNVYSATTDANGEFLFKNVPATGANITSIPYNDGTTDYGTISSMVILNADTVINMGEIATLVPVNAGPQIAASNFLGTQKIDVNQNISLSFSKEIEQGSFEAVLDFGNIPVTISWGAKAISTVTINPGQTLNPGSSYNLAVNGTSTDGLDFAYSFTVNTVDGIHYVSSNLYSIEGTTVDDFAVDGNITVDFTIAPNQAQTEEKGSVWLKDEHDDFVVVGVSYSGNTMTVNPDANLTAGKQYSLTYQVFSEYDNDNTSKTIYFETASNITTPTAVTGFMIDEAPTWKADYDTRNINFKFNRVSGAESYLIWAKDDKNNQNYVYLGFVSDLGDYDQTPTITINKQLKSQFDFYENDGVVTPFSHGTTVTYKIQAYNSAGLGAWSNTIAVKDETPLDNSDMDILGWQYNSDEVSTSANNGGSASSLTIYLDFEVFSGRYLNEDGTLPSVSLWNGATQILGAVAYAWGTHSNGKITIVIPAGQDYSGYELRLGGTKDSSGNIQSTDYEVQTLY